MGTRYNMHFDTDVAVIGAGPYGLSLGAHFRHHGIAFRAFGKVMDTWRHHMPKGMLLKSDAFASNISAPDEPFRLKDYCTEQGIEYRDTGLPVRLETFTSYGLAFQERILPEVENTLVQNISRVPHGFRLQLEDGEMLTTRRLVLAVGITHFAHIPEPFTNFPAELVSHSSAHHDLNLFRGRTVAVIGSGSSALDLAGLLHQTGALVQLVSRKPELNFHNKQTEARSFWQQVRHPRSGIGTGLTIRLVAEAPLAFHYLPERLRIKAVQRILGPAAGWFCKDMVVGRVSTLLGYAPHRAEPISGGVRLHLRTAGGMQRELTAQHIIAATGYRVRMDRLKFLSNEIRSQLKTINGTPSLSSTFESTVPGLYFVGPAAANSFGPVMRFAFGAQFAAAHVSKAMIKSILRERASILTPNFVSDPT